MCKFIIHIPPWYTHHIIITIRMLGFITHKNGDMTSHFFHPSISWFEKQCFHQTIVENEGISCEKAISSKNNMCGKTISGYYIYMRKSNSSSRFGLVKTIVTMVPWISTRVFDLGVSHCSRCPWRFSSGATITVSCVGHWYICWLQYSISHRIHVCYMVTWIPSIYPQC